MAFSIDADAGGRVTALEELRQRSGCDPRQDARLPLDHHDIGAKRARGRGDLQADIAGTDDRDARASGAAAALRRSASASVRSATIPGEVVARHGKWPRKEPVARIRWS